jgi:signal peptidase I
MLCVISLSSSVIIWIVTYSSYLAVTFFNSIFTILFFPFALIWRVMEGKHNFFIRVATVVFALVIALPVWIAMYVFTWFTIIIALQVVGITKTSVPVVGASMLPTLPETGFAQVRRYPTIEQLKPQLGRGDLVVFENEKTAKELAKQHKNATGFVKRIVAIPGDRVMMKDGFVYVNDELKLESYTYKPRSTFGGQEVRDCQQITVPAGHYFVLGDNRKVSLDSRHIGVIAEKDIEFYLSYQDQIETYSTRWRDASNDATTSQRSIFNVEEYVRLLNAKREENGAKPLRYQPKLTESAKKRAQVMLEYDDLSFEATKSAYPMEKAVADVGYYNIVYGEVPIIGYYNEQELIDAFFERANSREFLLGKEYQEIGISTFVGNLHGCPVQIVVQHIAGYVPPDYEAENIAGWESLLSKLKDIQVGWQKLKEHDEFYNQYKNDIDRINEIVNIRIVHTTSIVNRMKANQWLTKEEQRYIEEDKLLDVEQDKLAEKLNEAIQKQ